MNEALWKTVEYRNAYDEKEKERGGVADRMCAMLNLRRMEWKIDY